MGGGWVWFALAFASVACVFFVCVAFNLTRWTWANARSLVYSLLAIYSVPGVDSFFGVFSVLAIDSVLGGGSLFVFGSLFADDSMFDGEIEGENFGVAIQNGRKPIGWEV